MHQSLGLITRRRAKATGSPCWSSNNSNTPACFCWSLHESNHITVTSLQGSSNAKNRKRSFAWSRLQKHRGMVEGGRHVAACTLRAGALRLSWEYKQKPKALYKIKQTVKIQSEQQQHTVWVMPSSLMILFKHWSLSGSFETYRISTIKVQKCGTENVIVSLWLNTEIKHRCSQSKNKQDSLRFHSL